MESSSKQRLEGERRCHHQLRRIVHQENIFEIEDLNLKTGDYQSKFSSGQFSSLDLNEFHSPRIERSNNKTFVLIGKKYSRNSKTFSLIGKIFSSNSKTFPSLVKSFPQK